LDFDWLEYHHWLCTAVPAGRTRDAVVRDNDPYNLEGARELNDVRDLLLTCRVIAEGEGRFALRVQAGDDRFQAVFQPGDTLALERNGQLLSERPLPRGFARRGVDLEFGLCDRQVLLVAEGRTLFRVPYDLADARHRDVLLPLAIGTQGMTLEVSRLQVWRDLYYLEPQRTARPWTAQEPLAAGHYLLLGDNQPASQDGREWLAGVPRSAVLGRVYRPFWASR
jgi:hypothetical protein